MALNDILTSMDGARDALVTAINAKGGSLAQDSTLYQCAHAVTNIDSNPGTDTTDATATASDILQDKTAYAKNEKITGTIPTVTASMSNNVVTVPKGYVKSVQTLTVGTALNAFTITPAANAQVISKGSYLKGEVTVAGDTNLTAANIKSGVTIFNVAGTYEGESTGGTSAEYYKCASVDTGGVITDGKTLTVSGCMWGSWYNGTYALQDESATGYDRVWVHSDGRYALKYYTGISYIGNTNGGWGFFDLTYPNMDPDYLCEYDDANPWEHTIYQNAENGEEDTIHIVPSTTVVPGNTWSGYKAVFDSGAGTWSFESGVTSGLTYTSVTPTVGGIYSADALVIVSLLYDKICNRCTAYYRLDGNCRDSVNIHDGIPNKITFVDGKIGRCAQTNGSSQYISLPNEVSVKGRTQVSYSGWCFIESTPNKDFYIVTEIANSSGYTRAAFGVNTSLLPFAGVRTVATGDTGSFQKVTGTSPMSTGTWYFLCAVFDLSNGNIILYVNGVAVGSLDVTASSFVDANPNRIRLFEFDESGSGNVRADEVGIWSRALSATEVSELYNNGAGKLL